MTYTQKAKIKHKNWIRTKLKLSLFTFYVTEIAKDSIKQEQVEKTYM